MLDFIYTPFFVHGLISALFSLLVIAYLYRRMCKNRLKEFTEDLIQEIHLQSAHHHIRSHYPHHSFGNLRGKIEIQEKFHGAFPDIPRPCFVCHGSGEVWEGVNSSTCPNCGGGRYK